jgi:hypothetical protein
MWAGVANALPGLVLNADVELDSDADGIPDDWFHSDGVSYQNDNGPSSPGVKSIQIDLPGKDWRSDAFPIIPGAPYEWSFDYKFLEGATGEFRNQFRFFDGGAFKGEDNSVIAVSNIGQWQTATRMVTPLFDADIAAFPNLGDIRVTAGLFEPGNALVRFDNFLVRLVPEPTTFALFGMAGCGLPLVRARRRRP